MRFHLAVHILVLLVPIAAIVTTSSISSAGDLKSPIILHDPVSDRRGDTAIMDHLPLALVAMVFISITLFVFWVSQIMDIMRYPDGQFPGRYDKVCWLFIILAFNVVGAFIWWLFKNVIGANKSPQP
jgi:hypothetical protein